MDDVKKRLWALLEQESTLSLATVVEGRPAVAPLFYVPWDGALCWLSSPTSRHSQAVARDGRAAAAVYASTFDWQGILGAQLEGWVEVVEEPWEREAILVAYLRRFGLDESFGQVIGKSLLYRLLPTWARLLDNAAGFGGKAEVRWEPR
jgi:uncharacterized protein YhbP (UPF0306 family)